MSHHPSNTDIRIDQVLDALRTTEPPAGLESRIAARLSQAAESKAAQSLFVVPNSRASSASFFAVILNAVKDPRILLAEARPYTFAATALTLLLTVSTITILHRRLSTRPNSVILSEARTGAPSGRSLPAGVDSAQSKNPEGAHPATTSAHHAATNPALQLYASTQAFSLGSHNPTQETPVPPDPDTIALAETLAPSHPAPSLPLTAQERLLLTATQRGAPIELAELDLAREPFRAAQTREKAGLQQFVRSLVSQLVTSESLDPTPHSDTQTAPAPDPTSSSTNEPPTNGASPQ